MKTQRTHAIALLLSLCILTSCKEDPVKVAAKTFKDVAHTLGVLQGAVIEANGKGFISETDTRSILQASIKINEAGLRGVSILKTINGTIGKPQQEQVIAVLDSVLREIAGLETSLKIQDADTLKDVQHSFSLIKATVNSTKLIVATGGQQ